MHTKIPVQCVAHSRHLINVTSLIFSLSFLFFLAHKEKNTRLCTVCGKNFICSLITVVKSQLKLRGKGI